MFRKYYKVMSVMIDYLFDNGLVKFVQIFCDNIVCFRVEFCCWWFLDKFDQRGWIFE